MTIHLDIAKPIASLLSGTKLTRGELARRSGRAAGGIKTGPVRGLAALARLARLAGYELVLSLVPIGERGDDITMADALLAYQRGLVEGRAFVLGEDLTTADGVPAGWQTHAARTRAERHRERCVGDLLEHGWTIILMAESVDQVTVIRAMGGQRTVIGAEVGGPRAVHLD